MNNLTEFYYGKGTTSEGRSFDDIMAMTNDQIEVCHDIVQWMFPLHELSNFNEGAPVVTEEMSKHFIELEKEHPRMCECITRFANFLGFDVVNDDFVLKEGFKELSAHWRRPMDHNHLRITRAIRSMRLFGYEETAKKFFKAVYDAAMDVGCISPNNIKYWTLALEDPVFETLRK